MPYRCVQLVLSTDYDNPTIWAEFVNKMKDGILSAFDAALSQREEEVKRSEGQRQMPGWNFCTFFILKVHHICFFCHWFIVRIYYRKVLPVLFKA